MKPNDNLVQRCPVCRSSTKLSTPHILYTSCAKCEAIYQDRDIHPVVDYYSEIAAPPDFRAHKRLYASYVRSARSSMGYDDPEVVIDVGTGDGSFLEVSKKIFKKSKHLAVESSEIAQPILSAKDIRVIPFEQISDWNKKLVCMFQVLEHIADPVTFIKALNIENHDLLLLTTPSTDSPYYKRHGASWKSFSPSHHLVLYNRASLLALANECGLNLLHFQHCYSGNRLNGLIGSYKFYVARLAVHFVKLLLGRESSPPQYVGKNSLICLLKKFEK